MSSVRRTDHRRSRLPSSQVTAHRHNKFARRCRSARDLSWPRRGRRQGSGALAGPLRMGKKVSNGRGLVVRGPRAARRATRACQGVSPRIEKRLAQIEGVSPESKPGSPEAGSGRARLARAACAALGAKRNAPKRMRRLRAPHRGAPLRRIDKSVGPLHNYRSSGSGVRATQALVGVSPRRCVLARRDLARRDLALVTAR